MYFLRVIDKLPNKGKFYSGGRLEQNLNGKVIQIPLCTPISAHAVRYRRKEDAEASCKLLNARSIEPMFEVCKIVAYRPSASAREVQNEPVLI